MMQMGERYRRQKYAKNFFPFTTFIAIQSGILKGGKVYFLLFFYFKLNINNNDDGERVDSWNILVNIFLIMWNMPTEKREGRFYCNVLLLSPLRIRKSCAGLLQLETTILPKQLLNCDIFHSTWQPSTRNYIFIASNNSACDVN